MSVKIRSVPLPQVQPGMVLAVPVCDGAGNDLLAEGTELTAALLAFLLRRGVGNVQVAEEVHLSEAELATQRAAVVERVSFLFRHAGDDALMAALRETVLAYRLETLR